MFAVSRSQIESAESYLGLLVGVGLPVVAANCTLRPLDGPEGGRAPPVAVEIDGLTGGLPTAAAAPTTAAVRGVAVLEAAAAGAAPPAPAAAGGGAAPGTGGSVVVVEAEAEAVAAVGGAIAPGGAVAAAAVGVRDAPRDGELRDATPLGVSRAAARASIFSL